MATRMHIAHWQHGRSILSEGRLSESHIIMVIDRRENGFGWEGSNDMFAIRKSRQDGATQWRYLFLNGAKG